MKKNWLLLLGLIVGTEAVGFLSGFLAGDSRGIYENFDKIPLAPPGSIFGIVWPLLYCIMAIAFYLALTHGSPGQVKSITAVYLVQLALNFAWSIVFFRGDLMTLAILVILMLLGVVAFQLWYYKNIVRIAGYLLVPYLIWLLFATYLNIGFALVN